MEAENTYTGPSLESWQDLQQALEKLGIAPEDTCFIGELALDGSVRSTRYLADVETDCPSLVVPAAQLDEAAAFFPGKIVTSVRHLREAVVYCEGSRPLAKEVVWAPEGIVRDMLTGRAAEVLVEAGEHVRAGRVVYLEGPPGAGKSLVARRIVEALDLLSYGEALEISRIHCRAGILQDGLLKRRPFRAPHHTVSLAGLRGTAGRPGEVDLARHGVLFMDEAPEFRKEVLFGKYDGTSLVLAGNPCPCGYLGMLSRSCRCSDGLRDRYRARVSAIIEHFDAVRINI